MNNPHRARPAPRTVDWVDEAERIEAAMASFQHEANALNWEGFDANRQMEEAMRNGNAVESQRLMAFALERFAASKTARDKMWELEPRLARAQQYAREAALRVVADAAGADALVAPADGAAPAE